VVAIPHPDPPLEGDGVGLRPFTLADVPAVVAACQDPEIARFSPAIPFPYGASDARGWLASQEPARLAGQRLELAICSAGGEGVLLGAIGAHHFDFQACSCAVGYWLAAPARGHGHASAALRLLARWLFDALGLERVELTTDPDNLASQRVAQRCGFVREGRLRSHLRIRHSGERRDSLIYSLLPGELEG
jgi:RimJ/RimL family protein N-acetyltransferase